MILALECSQPHASLCLADDEGKLLYSATWHAERNHDAHLFPALQEAIDVLGPSPIAVILVGSGPGSYGGVRVALSAAVGIAMVHEAQTVAVPSWNALAADCGERACIVSDARRGGWTLRHPDGRIEVLTTRQLQSLVDAGMRLFSIEPAEDLAARGIEVVSGGLCPTAQGLVQTWQNLTPMQQQDLTSRAPEPIYVRPPHITAAKRKPWETKA